MNIIKNKRKSAFLLCLVLIWVFLILGVFFLIKSFSLRGKDLYSEKSTIEYSVCLKKNEYYEEECLSEEHEYLTSLTNEIRVLFNYNRVYVNNTKGKLKYQVYSKLRIFSRENNKEIYLNEKKITDLKEYKGEKKVYSLQDNTIIDLTEYSDIVSRYVNEYGVSSRASLEVSLRVGDSEDEMSEVATITLPLLESTYSIEKDTVNNKADENITVMVKNYLFLAILLFILDIVLVVVFLFRFVKNKTISPFELEVNRLLTDYDRIIVETKDNYINYSDKQLTEINEFMELVDVRDTLEKPILYIKQSEQIRDFVVQDQNVIYRYRMDSTKYLGEEVNNEEH